MDCLQAATHIFDGNAARGMTLCALNNGGGVGIGKSINGGFGLLLDGSEEVDRIIDSALPWDVMGGVARRAWAGNSHSMETSALYNEQKHGHVTLTHIADPAFLRSVMKDAKFSP